MMLQQRAMLANLSISMWTARKYDKKVSADVEAANQATDAGRFNKQLVNKLLLASLTSLSRKIRDYHYEHTLAWGDNGDRLLPSAHYFSYTQQMRVYRDEWARLVDEVVDDYPQEVHNARTRLGNMYDAEDYPDVSHVAERFNVGISFMPVPDAKDFRVDLGDDVADQLRAEMQVAIDLRAAAGVKECWNRLRVTVQAAHEKLSDPEAIFRDSLIENMRDLTELLPSLNLTNDEDLNDVCATVKRHLLVDPEALRIDKSLRRDVVRLAAQIIKRFPTVH